VLIGAFIFAAVIFVIAARRGYDRLPLYISGATLIVLALIAVMIAYNL
jgi:hypothetical protein